MPMLFRRALSLATFLVGTSPHVALAQVPAAAPAVADFAGAEAALPNTRTPRSRPHLVRWSPDHDKCAWIVPHSGVPDDPRQPAKPDEIELFVEDLTAETVRSTRIEVGLVPHDRRCGPLWTADGGVLVAYDVPGKDTATDACVDVVRDGAAKPFLRKADASVQSLAGSLAGTVAIAFRHPWNGTNGVIVCGADGERRALIDLHEATCVAAAPSPDGERIALLMSKQIAVIDAAGGTPRQLASLERADNDVTADRDVPQWFADGKSFLVAAGGEVVLVQVDRGEVRRWTRKALGGEAVDAVVLPGDAFAGAVVLRQTDANLADVLLRAGCASHSSYLSLVWLDLRSGASKPSSIANKWVPGGGWLWVDMPRVGDLVAEFAR